MENGKIQNNYWKQKKWQQQTQLGKNKNIKRAQQGKRQKTTTN